MDKMKRLLCLIGGMNSGGAETFLMKVYRKLDKTQYQMDFCVNIEEKGFYDDEIVSLGGKIFYIPPKSKNPKEFRCQLRELVKNEKYEYVLRVTSNALGFWDLKIAKDAGARVCIARSSNSSDGAGWKSKVAHLLGHMLYRRYVDVKIAPSDLAARYTFGKKAYETGEVVLLKNALDLNVYKLDFDARRMIRNELEIGDDICVIGHIGRFVEQKNHKFLIEIFNETYKVNTEVRLLLVGEGALEKDVKEQVKDLQLNEVVRFLGIRKDIPEILSAMDVFVMPSLYEGMPNTVIEAQATGLPCVISDSITREADVTGLVEYVSLEEDASKWAEKVVNRMKAERSNVQDKLRDAGYEMSKMVRVFEENVFR